MLGESSFTLLREIGTLPLAQGEDVRVTIEAYRGYRYVSVRRYITTDGFSGATRDGLTLTPEIVRALAPRLAALAADPREVPDGEIGKFAKRQGMCVVVSIGSFKGRRGLVLRQWQADCGWTKKGIWLPLEKLGEIKALFCKAKEALDEQPEDDF
ncbi:MAG: transcriptional coactivator p15/PC4 family protein [Elusimicrobiaceae bacterium]|nr:transcriptional coactivator p15/PC4 family protein [Elusimicrobiaceae bacterium]